MSKHLAWTLTLGVLATIAAEKHEGSSQCPSQFQGTWKAQSLHLGEKRLTPEQTRNVRLTIRGDRWVMIQGDTKHKFNWKLEPSKNPDHLDLMTTQDGEELTIRCLCELQGDYLTVCRSFKNPGKRPRKLAPAAGMGVGVFKREK